MKKGVTLKDIAKKLNMSISTVSKAINNDETISQLTRERVHAAALELNYVPNEAARNFKLNKTYTISLIIPNLLDQFFVLAINGVEAIAKEKKYNVIFSQSQEDIEVEEKILQLMIRNRVDGIIVVLSKNKVDMKIFDKMDALGIPVVFIARKPADELFNYVVSDNKAAAFDATEYLVKKGHKRIAHLMGPALLRNSRLRCQGYKDALTKHEIPLDEKLIKEVDFSKASIAKAMQQLMKLPKPPTAVFVYKTYVALDAIEFLKKSMPEKLEKIDFIGFGNLPLLQHLDHKPVASIEENSFEMGEQAAKLLFKLIETDNTSPRPQAQHIYVAHKLVEH